MRHISKRYSNGESDGHLAAGFVRARGQLRPRPAARLQPAASPVGGCQCGDHDGDRRAGQQVPVGRAVDWPADSGKGLRHRGKGSRVGNERDAHERVSRSQGQHGAGRLRTDRRDRPAPFPADEPPAKGGNDAGPAPHEWVLAGLASCVAMTVQGYAKHKGLRGEARGGPVRGTAKTACSSSRGTSRSTATSTTLSARGCSRSPGGAR